MPENTPKKVRRTCFVVMGFGKKTDFETGRTLDLDKTYRNIIKPAVEEAGLKCVRADEIVHSGLIDVPMYEELLNADVVVADLSTSNKNAFYELGVRHALRPYTTIVICEDGIKSPLPFDINHVVVRMYHHLGEDIGFEEVMRFRKELTESINTILNNDPPNNDSPVYTFINGLTRPTLKTKKGASGTAQDDNLGEAVAAALGGPDDPKTPAEKHGAETHSVLMQQVEKAQKAGDFVTAKALLTTIRVMMKTDDLNRPDDPDIIQRLALVTYKSKLPTRRQALEEAQALLETLDPTTSNDTETLGLWGAVNKRLWEETSERKYLDRAVSGYERGFYLRNDYYNGINLAYMLNVRAANAASRAEAIADFVQAERIRREVLSICEVLLKSENLPESDKYWTLSAMAEAYLGIGDEANAQKTLQEAFAVPPVAWMKESTEEQTAKLRPLLADSPLKYVKTD
jgi:tetratricopeptide (TPR) repeat protein